MLKLKLIVLIYLGKILTQSNLKDKNPINNDINAKFSFKWINLKKSEYKKKDLFIKKVVNSLTQRPFPVRFGMRVAM